MLKYSRFSLSAILLSATLFSQSPVGNTVYVKLDRTTIVGSQPLAPGDYTIREVTSASNPRVLEFTTDRGTKLAATVTAIPLLQNTPPGETKVVLDTESGEPRLSKIWVQGKDYGYEFPKEFSFGRPLVSDLQLRYDTPQTTAAASTSTTTTTTTTTQAPAAPAAQQNAQVQQTPSPSPAKPAEVAQAQPPPARAPETPAPQTEAPAPRTETAQAETPAPPAPAAPGLADQNTRDRQAPDGGIPATALGWADLLLIGFVCAGTGLFLMKRAA
jgi:hypothetical protein